MGAEPARRLAARAVQVEIQPGWGAKEAGDALQAHGVIGSSLAFQIWAKVSGTNFQAGAYELNEHLGVREAAAALRRGPGAASHLTLALPPGLTLNQIADRVGQLPGHNRDSFLQTAASGVVRSTLQPPGTTSLEGLTWPDTYFIGEQQTDEDILRTIVTAFDEHAAAAGRHLVRHGEDRIADAGRVDGGGRAARRRRSSPTGCNRACSSRSTPRSATRREAVRRCRTTPTSRSTRPTTPTRSSGLPPTPIMTVTEPALSAAAHPADVALPLLRDGQRRRHPLRDDARGARAQHRPVRGEWRMNVTGSTRLAAVIGDPIRHSRSPAIHNAAFAAAGPRLGVRRVRGARRARGAPR